MTRLRVAIVGAGPAGLYAAGHLIEHRDLDVEIDFIERLPTPWGLVRSGVAPDHAEKKRITDRLFDFTLRDPRVRFFGNIAVGTDVEASELAEWYDAVIYAHGAGGHVPIGIQGEELPGVWGAREFVQFYNAHPDQAHLDFDLRHPRAIIVGNGNVSMDIARILTSDIAVLEKTDIAEHALAALRASRIEEVVIMGRRDLESAAFNNPELEEFGHCDGVDIFARGDIEPPQAGGDALGRWRAERRYEIFQRLLARPRSPGNRRVVFHFLASPMAIRGNGRVERVDYVTNYPARRDGAVTFQRGDAIETLEAGLVVSACGYRGSPLAGLPFDPAAGVIPNVHGRVTSAGRAVAGTYVTGWIKRGCRGIIGSNRRCAQETVALLVDDLRSERLQAAALDAAQVADRLTQRNPRAVSFGHWRAIDRAERLSGRNLGRPRIKIATIDGLLDTAFEERRRAPERAVPDGTGAVP